MRRSYPREQKMHTDRGFQNQLEVYAALAADRKVERGEGVRILPMGKISRDAMRAQEQMVTRFIQ
jgi:hypothetical protein